jgi:hypothetical protein
MQVLTQVVKVEKKSNSFDTLLVKLLESFTDWDAYKLGLIDESGKIIEKNTEGMLPSEKALNENALSDSVKVMIKLKKYIGENNINKLELYLQTLKEQENRRIREADVLQEKVNKRHKIKDVAYDVEKLLTKEGITRDEYLNYLLENK